MQSSAPYRPDPTRARYETLLEVAESIAAHRQLSTLFADLSRLLKPLVPFDFISLTLVDPKERVVRLHILETDQPIVGKPPGAPRSTRPPPSSRSRPGSPITFPTSTGRPLPHHSRSAARQRRPVVPASCRCSRRSANSAACTSVRMPGTALHAGRHRIHGAGGAAGGGGGGQRAEFRSRRRLTKQQLARERDRLRTLLEVNNAVVGCLETRSCFRPSPRRCAARFGLDYASLLLYDAGSAGAAAPGAGFSRRQRRHPRGRHRPLDDTLAGYRLPHPPGLHFHAGGGARHFARHRATCSSAKGCNRCAACRCSRAATRWARSISGARRAKLLRRATTCSFFTQVAGQVAIALDNALSYQRIEELNARLAEEKVYLEDEIRTDNRFEEIVGQSRALQDHVEAGGDRGAHRFHRADLWRDRHRQGTAGARHPRPERAQAAAPSSS